METERLILRKWTKDDAEALFQLASDIHVGPPCGWTPHKDLEESKYILENILMNDYTYAMVLKENNRIIGDISIMPFGESVYSQNEDQAEIGFWLGYDYWGNGYMPEACKRIIEYGFNDLNLKEILCCHNITNNNSAKAQKKAGFTKKFEDTRISKKTGEKVINIVNHIMHN